MKVNQKKRADLPGAWIVNPKDKGRKSIKGDKVYLENDQEFEIEIFNPLKESVLIDIRLNGNSISKNGLVVKPGQRIYLDCFVDDRKKFTFKTYNVENLAESLEAISENGMMEVFFYKEESVLIKNWNDRYHTTIIHQYVPYYPFYTINPWIYGGYTGGITFASGSTLTTSTSNANGLIGSNSTLSNSSGGNLASLGSANTCNNNIGSYYSNTSPHNSFLSDDLLETGRVEKGSISGQEFAGVDMDFEENYIHHIIYQLLPESRKPIESKDIPKVKSTDLIDILSKLGELKDAGFLTEEEFQGKKKEILSRI